MAVLLSVISVKSMVRISENEVESQLEAYSASTVARYDELNSANYTYCGNGMMKGAIQLTGSYEVMDFLKEQTGIETAIL